MSRNPVFSIRVRPGTALARLLAAQDGENATERMHKLAERLETLEDVRAAIIKARIDSGDLVVVHQPSDPFFQPLGRKP